MKPPSRAELVYLLRREVPRDRKLALQLICETIEAGWTLDWRRDPELARLVSEQKGSPDTDVRRWLYKVIGLSRDIAFVPYLRGQLTVESDPEGRSWGAAALIAIAGADAAFDYFRSAGHSQSEINDSLVSARYFRPLGPPIDHQIINRLLNENEPLSLRWLSLIYGKKADLVPRDMVRELNRHDHPLVAEYSLWALTHDPLSRFSDTSLFPQDLPAMPANVRRWYYQFLTHDPLAVLPNWDVVEVAMSDPAPEARQGLATGLAQLRLPRHLAEQMVQWFEVEGDIGVRRALMKGFIHNRRHSAVYRSTVAAVQSAMNGAVGAGEFGGLLPPAPSKAASIFVVQRARRAKGPELLGIPDIRDATEDFFSFLAVDTVRFSERPDKEQLAIVQSFVDSFRAQQDISRLPSEDVIPLFTGDGLILAVRGASNATVVLDSALDIRRRQLSLFKYELRFGVHCGSTQLVLLSDGSRQLIGHAINWTARVMSCAEPSEILVSGAYYGQVLHDGRELLRGYSLERVTGLTDKLDNAVDALRVINHV